MDKSRFSNEHKNNKYLIPLDFEVVKASIKRKKEEETQEKDSLLNKLLLSERLNYTLDTILEGEKGTYTDTVFKPNNPIYTMDIEAETLDIEVEVVNEEEREKPTKKDKINTLIQGRTPYAYLRYLRKVAYYNIPEREEGVKEYPTRGVLITPKKKKVNTEVLNTSIFLTKQTKEVPYEDIQSLTQGRLDISLESYYMSVATYKQKNKEKESHYINNIVANRNHIEVDIFYGLTKKFTKGVTFLENVVGARKVFSLEGYYNTIKGIENSSKLVDNTVQSKANSILTVPNDSNIIDNTTQIVENLEKVLSTYIEEMHKGREPRTLDCLYPLSQSIDHKEALHDTAEYINRVLLSRHLIDIKDLYKPVITEPQKETSIVQTTKNINKSTSGMLHNFLEGVINQRIGIPLSTLYTITEPLNTVETKLEVEEVIVDEKAIIATIISKRSIVILEDYYNAINTVTTQLPLEEKVSEELVGVEEVVHNTEKEDTNKTTAIVNVVTENKNEELPMIEGVNYEKGMSVLDFLKANKAIRLEKDVLKYFSVEEIQVAIKHNQVFRKSKRLFY